MYLDIVRAEEGLDYVFPMEIQKEANKALNAVWFPPFGISNTGLIVNGNLHFDGDGGSILYSANSPLDDITIKKLTTIVTTGENELQTPLKNNADDNDLIARMTYLAINILLFLSAYPLEYEVNHREVIRKPKSEGDRFISGLYNARFVGQSQLRPNRDSHPIHGELTGRHLVQHWRAGHWKRVPCGPKHSERKLAWIGTYQTHGMEIKS
jgi:hypothetical protein